MQPGDQRPLTAHEASADHVNGSAHPGMLALDTGARSHHDRGHERGAVEVGPGPLVGSRGASREAARAGDDHRNGRAAAVLISPEDLAELEETLSVLADPEALSDIREADASYARGDVVRGVDAVRALKR